MRPVRLPRVVMSARITHVYTVIDLLRSSQSNIWRFFFIMPRLNNQDRGRILGMLESGISQSRVTRRVNVARSTIVRLVRRVNETGSVSDRPRPGAPRVTSMRQDNFIRQRHLRNRFVTAQSTTSVVVGNRGRHVSRNTVRRRLRERGILCRRPYRGVVLTDRHRRERQQWAQNNIGRRWRDVVFSDESRFNVSFADGRVRIYRRRNERYANNCVLEHDRFGGGSVMVWAAINHTFKTDLVVIHGNLNARGYVNQVIRPVVVPLFQQRPALTFQHDNARPHTARFTRNFLIANNIDVLPWPANSPDCNPIEHMWDVLGRRLRRRDPQPQNVQQLTNALHDEWARIPRYLLRNLCGSMRRRLQAVIASHGGHTRY